MQHVLGQPRALEVLQAGLASGRVHHAFIFHGPAGVGKFTAARALAQVLLCQAPTTTLTGAIEACGACASCRLIGAGPAAAGEAGGGTADADDEAALASAHPELHIITKELARYSDERTVRERKLTQIPVDVLRTALLEPVYRQSRMPGRLASKVFVVDEAELLNPTGQNLLLKTLEEPPEGTVIVLVTASEDRLLPTIRSRCQRVGFVPLSDGIVREWLRGGAAAGALAPDELAWVVEFAQGSLGRAELAIRYGLTEWARWVLPDLDRLAKTGATRDGSLGADMAERIDAFAVAWVDSHDGASKEAANKLASGLMWSAIATHARKRMLELSAGLDPADPVAAEAALGPWLGVIAALEDAQRRLASNVNLSLVCDHLASVFARVLRGERVASAGMV